MKAKTNESAAIIYHHFYGTRTGIHTGPVPSTAKIGERGMNMQQVRLANTSHILVQQRGGSRQSPNGYAIGEHLLASQDVDLQVEDSTLSVPRGSVAVVRENNSKQVLLDLGEGLGQFVIDLPVIDQYFTRQSKKESVNKNHRRVHENDLTATPGAYIEVTGYDPAVGNNRGPKSPGLGGYSTLIGQRGQLATLFGEINGIKTYKVQLQNGGEFVLGETEFRVITGVGTQKESIKESVEESNNKVDFNALMALGFGN